jgi:hypothetical protein
MSACSLSNYDDSTQEAAAPEENEIVVETSAETAMPNYETPDGFKTFIDTTVGYAFDYPEDWTMLAPMPQQRESSVAYAITLASYNFLTVQGGSDGIPQGESKYDLYVQPQELNTIALMRSSLDQSVAEGESQLLEERNSTLIDGAPALYTRHTDRFGIDIQTITTIINGRGVQFAGYNNPEFFDEIVGSLRTIPVG